MDKMACGPMLTAIHNGSLNMAGDIPPFNHWLCVRAEMATGRHIFGHVFIDVYNGVFVVWVSIKGVIVLFTVRSPLYYK